MRFFQAIFLGLFLFASAEGKEEFHIKGPFDLDKDKLNECLIFNSKEHSVLFVEIISPQKNDTLWTYKFQEEITVIDGSLIDLDYDGLVELVIIPKIINIDDYNPWLYVFKGLSNTFTNEPFSYSQAPLSLTAMRPSSLTLTGDITYPLGVYFGSPIRKGMVFSLEISGDRLKLNDSKFLSNPNSGSGYSVVQMSSFSTDNRDYISYVSVENDSLHTTIFNVKDDYTILSSSTMLFGEGVLKLSKPMMPRNSKNKGKDGLLIPTNSNEVILLNLLDSEVVVSSTNALINKVFPNDSKSDLYTVLKHRENVVALNSINANQTELEKRKLPAPDENFSSELSWKKKMKIPDDKIRSSLSNKYQNLPYKKSKKTSESKNYNMLSPTLGDFLKDLNQNNDNKHDSSMSTVPQADTDMKSTSWASEAGFTYMDLEEYNIEKIDTIKPNPIPELDTAIAKFTNDAKQFLTLQKTKKDSNLNDKNKDKEKIDLYYVLVMTPATETKDRYIFDGEAPFGVAVNQVPPTGSASHFQHSVSADIANLNPGEKYDFAYSLRDGYKDTITTLTMIHDLQTNVVLMSISPTVDSISQAYQPESFDPKLFEFPNYFFEGFPTSLDMDFTDKLIRFSFDGVKDSTYQGIYLSSTTPSNPPQSLAIFLDQGKIQSIKGEVVVRANGSKKITTQFDLVGSVEPSLMFSKLIQESFPEDLKVKLLQGASLEEPLFGPKGKIPKVVREPRLPEAQLALPQQEVPIVPKQTVVPDINSQILESNVSNKAVKAQPQENDQTFINSNLEERVNENKITKIDSLRLEHSKKDHNIDTFNKPPVPEKNQIEIDSIIDGDD